MLKLILSFQPQLFAPEIFHSTLFQVTAMKKIKEKYLNIEKFYIIPLQQNMFAYNLIKYLHISVGCLQSFSKLILYVKNTFNSSVSNRQQFSCINEIDFSKISQRLIQEWQKLKMCLAACYGFSKNITKNHSISFFLKAW